MSSRLSGPRRLSHSLAPLALAALIALAPRPSRAAPTKLLVLHPDHQGGFARDDFALALALQLAPYGVKLANLRWRAPATTPAAKLLAPLLRRHGARSLVWYRVDKSGVTFFAHEHAAAAPRTIRSGPLGSPLEREAAAALRTLLVAKVLRLPALPSSKPASQPVSKPASKPTSKPASQPTSKPASQPASNPTSHPTSNPAKPPRVRFGGGYAVETFPGGDIRHGPALTIDLRLWRWLHGGLTLGYRLPRRGETAAARWSRDAWQIALRLNVERQIASLSWSVGINARATWLGIEASAADGRAEDQVGVELGLGLQGALGWQPTRWVRLELRGIIGVNLIEERVSVAGRDVLDPGRLELSLLPVIQIRFL